MISLLSLHHLCSPCLVFSFLKKRLPSTVCLGQKSGTHPCSNLLFSFHLTYPPIGPIGSILRYIRNLLGSTFASFFTLLESPCPFKNLLTSVDSFYVSHLCSTWSKVPPLTGCLKSSPNPLSFSPILFSTQLPEWSFKNVNPDHIFLLLKAVHDPFMILGIKCKLLVSL